MVEARTSPSTRPKIVRAPLPIILPTIEMPEPIEEAASVCNALPSRDNADPPSPALNLKLSIVVRFRPSRKISLPSGLIIHSREEGRRVGGPLFYPFRNSSGSLAMLLANSPRFRAAPSRLGAVADAWSQSPEPGAVAPVAYRA